jgi:hypothetical protein
MGIVDGVHLDQYKVGRTYELPANLAMVLALEGFARIERRLADRKPDEPEWT